jgi:hypothetical protein
MKELHEYTDEEKMLLFLHSLDMAVGTTCADRKTYLAYKVGAIKSKLSDETQQEMDILTLQEELGFPMEELGTYLYKDVILETMKDLSHNDNKEQDVPNYLKDAFSNFYLNIAREDHDMGLKTFHKYIEAAIEKIDFDKANPKVYNLIFNNLNPNADYGELAFVISLYLHGRLNPVKVKKLSNMPDVNLKYKI